MAYGLEIYTSTATEFLSTLESFVFLKKVVVGKSLNSNTVLGVASNKSAPMIFIKVSGNANPAVTNGYMELRIVNGQWVLFRTTILGTLTDDIEAYIFVRMSEHPQVNTLKWGLEIYDTSGKVIQKSSFTPLKIKNTTGFNPGNDVMGQVVNTGHPTAVLLRIHSIYAAGGGPPPVGSLVVFVCACGTVNRIIPKRGSITPGTAAGKIVNDNNLEYIDTRDYD